MRMRLKRMAAVIAVAGVGAFAQAGEGEGGDTSWRVTAGGAMGWGLRMHGGVKSHGAWTRAVSGAAGRRPAQGTSRAEAQATGDSYGDFSGGRVDFPNGGFIDPDDSGDSATETWNWYLPAGALDNGGTMTLSVPYFEEYASESFNGIAGGDDGCEAGFSLGLDREVWRHGSFGVDVGGLFSSFRKDGFFKAGGRAFGRTESSASGAYVTDLTFSPAVVDDPWAQNDDGSYGAGSFNGPGPTLNLGGGDVLVTHRWANGPGASSSSSYSLRAKGDYSETELVVAAKPWWEPVDWFRVQGTLGVAVARAHAKFDVEGHGAGTAYSSRQRFDDWFVYGVGGLGGMFRYRRICLGFEFLARFLDDGMKIHGRDVSGRIDRGHGMFRVYFGWEF